MLMKKEKSRKNYCITHTRSLGQSTISSERVEKIIVSHTPGLLASQARLGKSIVSNKKSQSKRKRVEKNILSLTLGLLTSQARFGKSIVSSESIL